MMTEYLNKFEETKEAWENGWFHTGDIGFVDLEGFFYFIERKKDMIRRRGENVSPSDIEWAASLHQSVFGSCAVGIPSDLGEDDIALYLVLRSEIKDFHSFLSYLDSELPFYMMPTRICIVESLPKTPSYKIQRSKVRAGEIRILKEINVAELGFKVTRPQIR